MSERVPLGQFFNNPRNVVVYSNLFFIVILVPLLLFTVVGYYFAWHKISQGTIALVTAFISVWLGLFLIGYLGCRTWRVWGRVASFLAWFPALFAFPVGTVMAAWIIYSLFRKPAAEPKA